MLPLVTAIMPARGRREMARQSVECFLSQDYPNKELLILQDEDDRSFYDNDPIVTVPSVLVRRVGERKSIAWKRNALCEQSRGDLICHFDTDDLSSPGRISAQVRELEQSGKAVTGYRDMYFVDGASVYLYPGSPRSILGTSLMYRREWWQSNQFTDSTAKLDRDDYSKVCTGEDTRFVKAASKAEQLFVSESREYMAARIHSGNSSTKNPANRAPWKRATWEDVPSEFHSLLAVPA